MTEPLIVFALAAALGIALGLVVSGASLKYLLQKNRELRATVNESSGVSTSDKMYSFPWKHQFLLRSLLNSLPL